MERWEGEIIFIEIDQSSDGFYYLIIHSGSRNLGKQVAEHYQQLAIDLQMGKEEYFHQRDEIIRSYKDMGRCLTIPGRITKIKTEFQDEKFIGARGYLLAVWQLFGGLSA